MNAYISLSTKTNYCFCIYLKKKRFAKHTKHTANKLLNYFAIIKYYLINKMPL